MEQYDVSIVVPVYNRENIIKPCIESINAQTYDKSKWEVIFVDDASTDNTIETIESLMDKSINYRILKRPVGSGNASAPRNEGIKASSAKYLFFLDSDDYVDSELLENGMGMALKNNSDIVYVKMGGRVTPIRPFKVKIVDKADIVEHHLGKFFPVFKFFKLELLRKYNILFPPNITVAEDQIFSSDALLYSNIVSVLADKVYYFLVAHEDEHLSKKPVSLISHFRVIEYSLSSIYTYSSFEKKSKLYNVWIIRTVERLINLCKKRSIENGELFEFFKLTFNYFNIYQELFDLSKISPKEKPFTIAFLSDNYIEFYKMVQDLKALEEKQKEFQKKLKSINGFDRCWIYKNRTIVLEFIIDGNELAFDIKENGKVWFFSRNRPKSLDSLEKEILSVSKNKYLIYDSNIDESIEITKLVTKYLEKAKKIIDEQNNNT